MVADSGCTHILLSSYDSHLITPNNSISPLTSPIMQPDGSKLFATSSGTATIAPSLTVPAHLVPGLKYSLGGLAPIIDTGCTVLFSDKSVSIFRGDNLITTGQRHGNLWHLPIMSTTPHSIDPPPGLTHPSTALVGQSPDPTLSNLPEPSATAYNSYPFPQSNHDWMLFWQMALCNPTKSTLVQAAVKGLLPWPSLTPAFIRKHYVPTLATSKGHLHRLKAGTQ